MDLYVYYKVRREDSSALRDRALAMQARLTSDYGMATSLKRRPEERDGRQTWMEVYLGVPEGFGTVVEHAAAEAGLPALIDGMRHLEQFMDVTSCA